MPVAVEVPSPATASKINGQNQLTAEDEAAVALDLDPDKFPVERYKPLLVIDQGASGTIYCCADRLLAKRVAIKTLHHVLAEQLLNFQREAKTTSRLVHNNIVQTLDFGITSSGTPYMVMELISGESLKTKVERTGALPPHAAIHLIYTACLGLSHAHANGVLHRDVKSKNIMVLVSNSDYPDAKLIDFGIASHEVALSTNDLSSTTAGDSSEKQRVTIVGTPSYMSPDQALGRKYDERSEVYSLGCCLFEALTGELPFHADSSLELIQKHANEPPPTLAHVAEGNAFSNELEEVVKKCLSKNPAERYQTVAELASALKALPEHGRQSVPSKTILENKTASSQNKKLEADNTSAQITRKVLTLFIGSFAVLLLIVVGVTVSNLTSQLNEKENSPTTHTVIKPKPFVQLMPNDLQQGLNQEITNFQKPGPEESTSSTKGEHAFVLIGSSKFEAQGDVRDEDFKELASKKFNELVVSNKRVTGVGLSALTNCGLTRLTVEESQLTDDGMAAISKIKTLEMLDLRENPKLSARGIAYLPKLRHLSNLCLRGSGITDDAVPEIIKCKELHLIDLSVTNVTMKRVVLLSSLPKLDNLNLADSAVERDLPGLEMFAPKIKLLSVAALRVGDRVIMRISKFPRLNWLDVSQNAITDIGLQYLERMPTLQYLHAKDCEYLSAEAMKRFQSKRPDVELVY